MNIWLKKSTMASLLAVLTVATHAEGSSREVTLQVSPAGHEFNYMGIDEEGVTDVSVVVAFPARWALTDGMNQATPYVGAEAILNGQTDTLRPQDILELFNDKNASGNVYARPDYVVGQLNFPIEHASDVVPVAGELLAAPVFEERWVERIKQGLKERSQEMATQTTPLMFDASRAAIIQNSALLRSLSIPLAEDVDAVSQEDLLRWHAETFTLADVSIAVAGALSSEQAGEIVDSLLQSLPEGKSVSAISVPMDFTARTVLLHVPEAEKTTLSFIGRLPESSAVGDLTDLLLLSLFAQTGSGPLFDALRTELRATYGFQAGYANYDSATRFFYIVGELDSDALNDVVDVVRKTYADYRQGKTLDGFEELQANVAQGTADNMQYVNVAAQTMLELAIGGENPGLSTQVDELIRDLTLSQLQSRLDKDYPGVDELLVFAASADNKALPEACVISSVDQIEKCKP